MMNRQFRQSQQGAALIVSLMILIVMTLIGLTGMGTSGMEEKMAGNVRDRNLAFQAAEAALRDGEAYYKNVVQVQSVAFDGTNQGLIPAGTNPDPLNPVTWANSRTYSGTINGITTQPRYIIELLGTLGTTGATSPTILNYGDSTGQASLTAVRITARGTGGSNNAVVYLQSNFAN